MIYLDNAATSYPKPPALLPYLDEYLAHYAGNPGRSGHRLSLAASEEIYRTRATVANFIGAQSVENIIFTQNATHALNIVIRARVRLGDHILISDLEHNSVFRPVWRLYREGLISYSIFSHTGNVLENIIREIRPNTRMIVCTHVSNVSGHEMPIRDIITLCHDHDLFTIIDASQSIGHQRIDVRELDCDALCAPGHKGLLGLQGSGVLYLKNGRGLRDVFQGGSGTDSLSPEMPSYLPDRFEAGTLPTPAILSMKVGIEYIHEVGIDHIHHQEIKLSRMMHRHIGEIENAVLYSQPTSGIITFNIEGIPSDDVADELNTHGICARGGYHCAPLAHRALRTPDGGAVRLSAGICNTMSEIETVARHIREIAKKARQ